MPKLLSASTRTMISRMKPKPENASGMWSPLFAGRARPDRQSMDPLAGNVTQRGIDQALALEAGDAREGLALHFDSEGRFPPAVVAGMGWVACEVLCQVQPGSCQ